MALFTRFCKAKPPYSETAEQVPKPPLTSSADCYALALVGHRAEHADGEGAEGGGGAGERGDVKKIKTWLEGIAQVSVRRGGNAGPG